MKSVRTRSWRKRTRRALPQTLSECSPGGRLDTAAGAVARQLGSPWGTLPWIPHYAVTNVSQGYSGGNGSPIKGRYTRRFKSAFWQFQNVGPEPSPPPMIPEQARTRGVRRPPERARCTERDLADHRRRISQVVFAPTSTITVPARGLPLEREARHPPTRSVRRSTQTPRTSTARQCLASFGYRTE
jgi:hypothetical protein